MLKSGISTVFTPNSLWSFPSYSLGSHTPFVAAKCATNITLTSRIENVVKPKMLNSKPFFLRGTKDRDLIPNEHFRCLLQSDSLQELTCIITLSNLVVTTERDVKASQAI